MAFSSPKHSSIETAGPVPGIFCWLLSLILEITLSIKTVPRIISDASFGSISEAAFVRYPPVLTDRQIIISKIDVLLPTTFTFPWNGCSLFNQVVDSTFSQIELVPA